MGDSIVSVAVTGDTIFPPDGEEVGTDTIQSDQDSDVVEEAKKIISDIGDFFGENNFGSLRRR